MPRDIPDSDLDDAQPESPMSEPHSSNDEGDSDLSWQSSDSDPDDETEPPPGRWHQLPGELWSLIIALLDRRSLPSASLICQVAHQEVEPYLYARILWNNWRNRRVLALHRALQASEQRAQAVCKLAIRSVDGHVSAEAAHALIGILRITPNLKILRLNVFTQTIMENILQFEPLLDQLAAGCPFQLDIFRTDAPFEWRTVQFLAQQPDITKLDWSIARVGRPAPVFPPRALARLTRLRSAVGWRPFAGVQSLTHLCLDLPPQAQLDELLTVFADRLISLKLVQQQRAARPVLFEPAVAFRRGLPRTLRWLEVRELPSYQREEEEECPAWTDAFPFAQAGLALRVFVWQAAWMHHASPASCVEALRFADMLSAARVTTRFFVFFGDGEGDADAVTIWDLHKAACANSTHKFPDDCWQEPF